MAKYNPFLEKSGRVRVDYKREILEEKKIRRFLEARNFDFDLVRSRAYCHHFFSQLNDQDKKVLLNYLSEFSSQPFIKAKTVTPDLLTRVFSSNGVYLYWINGPKQMRTVFDA